MRNTTAPRAIFLGGEGVQYDERAPGPELAPWVAAFWRLRSDRSFVLRVLPDGCMDIIGGDLVASLATAIVAELQPGEDTYGIRFRPGGFTALFGVPATELVDQRMPLADVVRPRPLLELARKAELPDPLGAAALYASDIRELARESGYSARQLHRRVVAATGHSPKRLSRIGRMQSLLAAGRGESWAATAAERGYHDESHMINDVHRLARAAPQEMLGGRASPTEPVIARAISGLRIE